MSWTTWVLLLVLLLVQLLLAFGIPMWAFVLLWLGRI
jgi:hypothetical protein